MEFLIVLIIIIAGIVWFAVQSNKQAEEEKKALTNRQTQEVKNYLEKAKEADTLPEIKTHILMKVGERAFLQDNVKLLELRKVTKSQRGGGAVRVMKGVYIGSSRGTSRSYDELREIDQGFLILTNKRIIFDGGTNTRDFKLDKIISVSPAFDGIEIAIEGKTKSLILTGMPNPMMWATLIPNVRNF